jgi:hypothetical protein
MMLHSRSPWYKGEFSLFLFHPDGSFEWLDGVVAKDIRWQYAERVEVLLVGEMPYAEALLHFKVGDVLELRRIVVGDVSDRDMGEPVAYIRDVQQLEWSLSGLVGVPYMGEVELLLSFVGKLEWLHTS